MENNEFFQLDSRFITRNVVPTEGGERETIFINEPNLYRVIFRSNEPKAKTFQDWVFNAMLPVIRKTGRYEQPTPQPILSAEQWKVIRDLVRGHR